MMAVDEPTETLEPTDGIFGVRTGTMKWGYWRKPDKSLAVAPMWPTEYMNQLQQGWRPLDGTGGTRNYGQFLLTVNDREPFRRLFKMHGESEFTLDEILEHGWHRKPPYEGVVFPQLEGVHFEDVMCSFCGKPYLTTRDLAKHESIAHKDASGHQQIARALQTALSTGQKTSTDDLKALLATFIEGQTKLIEAITVRESGSVHQQRAAEQTRAPGGRFGAKAAEGEAA